MRQGLACQAIGHNSLFGCTLDSEEAAKFFKTEHVNSGADIIGLKKRPPERATLSNQSAMCRT